MTNARGKTLTIFLILIMILLVSSTCIGFFLFKKEANLREAAESDLHASQTSEMKLQADLKEIRRQLALAQDKNKEADDKINNLMDEIELNEGLRKELKAENATIKEALELAKKEKESVRTIIDDTERRYKQATELYKLQQDKTNELQKTVKELEAAKQDLEQKLQGLKADLKPYNQRTTDEQVTSDHIAIDPPGESKVELDKIVVNPNDGTRGRVLSVDKDAEFLVCSLGQKQGIKSGDVLSVFRGEEYLGDVRVSRVQEQLSAADLIPPFSSRKVRKNDIVVFKP
jgi:hypothetical protein